jgi:hypothetical protein
VNSHYELVPLKNGVFSIRLRSNGETFHPVIGPVAEAEALYVRQLKLRERARDNFVIWDVGLGAGGNVLTAIRHLADVPITLHIISFDHTLEALRFAMEHASQLEFPAGFEEPIQQLLRDQTVTFQHSKLQVRWTVHVADFPALLAGPTALPAPDTIFFDAYSPARNAVASTRDGPARWPPTRGALFRVSRCCWRDSSSVRAIPWRARRRRPLHQTIWRSSKNH